jgi:two-component system, OmpR family, response regulator
MRILLIEDDVELADGLARVLRLGGYVVDAFHTGARGLAAADSAQYDVVILDLGLPDLDGLVVLRRLRAAGTTCPILILTARDELSDRIQGLDSGADDYMVKPFAMGELEARLRALMRRPRTPVGPVITCGPLTFDLDQQEVSVAGERLELPARELAVLRKLLERAGHVVTKEALFERVYGWDDEARPQVIEVYVSRLRKRLEPAGIGIRSLRGLGYVLERTSA